VYLSIFEYTLKIYVVLYGFLKFLLLKLVWIPAHAWIVLGVNFRGKSLDWKVR
jgi:hypothetical protein